VRRDDETTSLDPIPVSVTVPVEKPCHHVPGGGHNPREPERFRLAPTPLLRDAKPPTQLFADETRHDTDPVHADIPAEKTRRHLHTLDRWRHARKRLGEHLAILLREGLALHNEADSAALLDASIRGRRAQNV